MPSEIKQTPRNKARAERDLATLIAASGLTKPEFIARAEEYGISYQANNSGEAQVYTSASAPKTFAWFLEIIESLTPSQINASISVAFPGPEVFTTGAPAPIPTQHTETSSTASSVLQPTSVDEISHNTGVHEVANPSSEAASTEHQESLITESEPTTTEHQDGLTIASEPVPTEHQESLPAELPTNESLVPAPSDITESLPVENTTEQVVQQEAAEHKKLHKSVNVKGLVVVSACVGVYILAVVYWWKKIGPQTWDQIYSDNNALTSDKSIVGSVGTTVIGNPHEIGRKTGVGAISCVEQSGHVVSSISHSQKYAHHNSQSASLGRQPLNIPGTPRHQVSWSLGNADFDPLLKQGFGDGNRLTSNVYTPSGQQDAPEPFTVIAALSTTSNGDGASPSYPLGRDGFGADADESV